MDNNDIAFDLLITIVDRGHGDDVIGATKSVGIEGGTVFYARGTGINETVKFLGVNIEPEKEMVFNLVPAEKKDAAMKAIVEKAGIFAPGKGICFSVPVDGVTGIAHFLKDSEANE